MKIIHNTATHYTHHLVAMAYRTSDKYFDLRGGIWKEHVPKPFPVMPPFKNWGVIFKRELDRISIDVFGHSDEECVKTMLEVIDHQTPKDETVFIDKDAINTVIGIFNMDRLKEKENT